MNQTAFDPAFQPLGEEIDRFANHIRRRMHSSRKARQELQDANLRSGGAAPLTAPPADTERAMLALEAHAKARDISATPLVGAYFSHHFLRQQAQLATEVLSAYRGDRERRAGTLYRCFVGAEAERKTWVKALLRSCLRTAAPALNEEDYVAFNAGSLLDYEDIDLAFIARDEHTQDVLQTCLNTVNPTFLRYASKVQLFLSEQVSNRRSAPLLSDYARLLKRAEGSVVSVMQLLGSDYLSGGRELQRALATQIVYKHYAHGSDPLVHEAFLRKLSKELRVMMQPRPESRVLSPKREVYLPAKLATAGLRVIHGVHASLPPIALRELAQADPELSESYQSLSEAFIENELMRTLLYVYVLPAERFDLGDADTLTACRRPAELLGLGPGEEVEGFLLDRYGAARKRALTASGQLYGAIERHLKEISSFRHLVRELDAEEAAQDDVPRQLLRALQQHPGGVFWDQVVNRISDERPVAFARGLRALPRREREWVAQAYVGLMVEDAAALLEFFVYLVQSDQDQAAEGPRPEGGSLAELFWDALTAHLNTHPNALRELAHSLDLSASAGALYKLTASAPPVFLSRFVDRVEAKVDSKRAHRVVRALRSMILLCHHRSNAMSRAAARAMTANKAQLLKRLGSSRQLDELVKDKLLLAAQSRKLRPQIDALGQALDVGFVKCALERALMIPSGKYAQDFVHLVDRYVPQLFVACAREVQRQNPGRFEHISLKEIALFSTGGYGRGESFGSDWDYFALIERGDPERKLFFGRALQRMSSAMGRRGLSAHNRFAEHFGAYVGTVPEVVEHLQERGPETFIDEAELLEARPLYGSEEAAARFKGEVQRWIIQERAGAFSQDLLRELAARRRSNAGLVDNPKSAPGGLREIHLVWLLAQVSAGLHERISQDVLPEVARALPGCEPDLHFLLGAHERLRRARELYRLTVAYDDVIDAPAFIRVGRALSPLQDAGVSAEFAEHLAAELRASALRIDRVIAAVEERLDTLA